jgi:hypothetical protein
MTTLEREIASLRQTVRSQEETHAFLQERYETLCRIENGGWWQLRGRILPLLGLLTRYGDGSGTLPPLTLIPWRNSS